MRKARSRNRRGALRIASHLFDRIGMRPLGLALDPRHLRKEFVEVPTKGDPVEEANGIDRDID